MASCGNGCGKTCGGSCQTITSGPCGASCSSYCYSGCYGNCTGSCSVDCSGTCQGGCTSCTGCTGCSGGCTNKCEGCIGCNKGCAGACKGTETYLILAAQFNDIAYSRGKTNRVTAENQINVSSYNALVSSDITAGTQIVKNHAKNMTAGNWTITLP